MTNIAEKRLSNKTLATITILGMMLFIPLFLFDHFLMVDFWWWMSLNLVVMTTLGFILDKQYKEILKQDLQNDILKKVLLGITSVLVLYLFFFIGNILSRKIFGFAGDGIQSIYDFKGNAHVSRIFLLMLFVIGPGEELFWRGFLQRNFASKTNNVKGFIIATIIYTVVHVPTGNIMLIIAALVAGIFWGWMYMRFKSLLINVISHTLWDIIIFILLPLNV